MTRLMFIGIMVVLVGVIAMLLYPSLHLNLGFVDTTGMLPLVKAMVTFGPYVFLIGALYGLSKLVRR